jgi:hypothetical protein
MNRPTDVQPREALRARPSPIEPARLSAANINPRTMLASDYLNHFYRATMLLELMPALPDSVAELAEWQPLSYCEHFAQSAFKERELAIQAYRLTDPLIRRRLDDIADELNAILGSTIDAIRHCGAARAAAVARAAIHRLRPLTVEAAALINGAVPIGVTEEEAGVPHPAVPDQPAHNRS